MYGHARWAAGLGIGFARPGIVTLRVYNGGVMRLINAHGTVRMEQGNVPQPLPSLTQLRS